MGATTEGGLGQLTLVGATLMSDSPDLQSVSLEGGRMTQPVSWLFFPRNLREGLEKLIAVFWERSSWLPPVHHPIFFSFLISSTVLLCKAVWLTACEWESEARWEPRQFNFQILIRTRFVREARSRSWPVGANWGWELMGTYPSAKSSACWASSAAGCKSHQECC